MSEVQFSANGRCLWCDGLLNRNYHGDCESELMAQDSRRVYPGARVCPGGRRGTAVISYDNRGPDDQAKEGA